MAHHAPIPFNFDPKFSGKVVKIGAAASVLVVLAAIVVVLAIDPSSTACPEWRIGARRGNEHSIWAVIGFAGLLAGWIVYAAAGWERWGADLIVLRLRNKRQLDTSLDPWKHLEETTTEALDINNLSVVVCVGWTLFCAIPFFFIVFECRVLPWPE